MAKTVGRLEGNEQILRLIRTILWTWSNIISFELCRSETGRVETTTASMRTLQGSSGFAA